jgi:galactokinase
LDELQLARLGQAVEVEFLGVPIGIMDQLVACLGRPEEALFIDTRSLATANLKIPAEVEVVVIDSGVTHEHSQSGYRCRREECERAAAVLGLRSLRDIGPGHEPQIAELDDTLRRRVQHVVSENARVLQLQAAFETGALDGMRDAFEQSHRSLRDDYEASTIEIDRLVEIASASPHVIGARMTGGGFGGSVVVLARAGKGAEVARAIAREYADETDKAPRILLPVGAG